VIVVFLNKAHTHEDKVDCFPDSFLQPLMYLRTANTSFLALVFKIET